MKRLLLLLAIPISLSAQKGAVIGVIIGQNGERLPYSIVGLPTLERELFSGDSGGFRFSEVPIGAVALRIKRLGYVPVDTVVTVSAERADTITFRLRRVATRLSRIDVTTHPPCHHPGAPSAEGDSSLATVFVQLKMNAEQYRFLANQYPFFYMLQINTSSRLRKDGTIRPDATMYQRVDAKVNWRYRPGQVVTRRGRDHFFQIPTIADFADKRFIDNHCFHFMGMRTLGDDDLLRVDLVAAAAIKEADVDGEIWLDPDTYQIKRTVLRLTRPPLRLIEVADLEVTTDFTEILPSISILSSVESVQLFGPSNREFDAAFEKQLLMTYQFLKGTPGQEGRKP